MDNNWLNKFKTTVKVRVSGKNIERFLKRLVSLNIELLEIEYLKYNEISIVIYKEDLSRIEEIKTIYDIEIISFYGFSRYKNFLLKNKIIISIIVLSFLFIVYLSRTIFSIEVVHNDYKIRDIIKDELNEYDIRVFSLKKSYTYINEVKQKILDKYKDKIEWLEIEESGTKYIIRVEERKLSEEQNDSIPRNIIAKKNALIIKVEATNGEIIKNKNDYVRKGDIIVSGDIKLNDEIKSKISATGKVYGEVWYKVTIEYPLKYIEQKVTGDSKKTYAINFLNHKFSYYNKYLLVKEKLIYKDNIIPFQIIKEVKNKVINVEETLNLDEATEKATLLGINKMKSKLNDNEYIIDTKKLKVESNNSKIILELFFTVCEDITDYSLIEGE